MSEAHEQVIIHPCTYEDKTYYEDDFDRESGRMYYTKYSSHEYTIKVDYNTELTEEFVFEVSDLVEFDDQTIDTLKKLSNGSYTIIKYNNIPGRRVVESYHDNKLKSSEEQMLHEDNWIRDGEKRNYWSNYQTFNYKMDKYHGWQNDFRKEDIIQRLYEDGACLGYRIIQDGKVVITNISEENLTRFPCA